MYRSLFLLPLLVACAPSEEKFQERFAEASCEAILECTQGGNDSGFSLVLFESQDQCESFYSLAFSFMGECDYDKKAAKECLNSLDDVTCEGSPETITACANVYSGSSCGWAGSGDSGWDSGW